MIYKVVGLEDGSWSVQDESGVISSRWRLHEAAELECDLLNNPPLMSNHYELQVGDTFSVEGQGFTIRKNDGGRVTVQPAIRIEDVTNQP